MAFSRDRFYGWWYFCIGLGFLLLAVQRLFVGGRGWLIVLRLVISAGFFVLAWMQLRGGRR